MNRIEVITALEEFPPLAREWDGLLGESGMDVPFLTPEWIAVWWKVYGGGNDMLLLAVRDGGRLQALAPLMRTRAKIRGIPVRTVSFMDNYHAGRMGVITRDEDPLLARRLFDFLLHDDRCRCDLFAFNTVLRGSATDRLLREGFAAHRVPYADRPGCVSPYIPVVSSWEGFLRDRSRNFRHKLNRIRNLFDRTGGWEVEKYTDRGIGRAMEEVLAVSEKTWKFGEGTAITAAGHNARFYTELAHAAGAAGWLELWVLRVGGRPVAFAYNLRRKGRVYALEIGFDEAYREMAPSEFLNTHAIRDCFENGLEEYDWLGHPLSFKLRWTTACREHRKYVAYNDTALGRALYFLERRIVTPLRPIVQRAAGGKEAAVQWTGA